MACVSLLDAVLIFLLNKSCSRYSPGMSCQNHPLLLLVLFGLKTCNCCKNNILAPVNKIGKRIQILISPCKRWGQGSMPPGLFGSYCREMVLLPRRGAYFCTPGYLVSPVVRSLLYKNQCFPQAKHRFM